MKKMSMNYNLSRMQKGSLYAEAMVIVYWIKNLFCTMKNLRYNSTKLFLPGINAEPCRSKGRLGRFLLTLCLMMASVGAWAQTQTLVEYYKFRTRNNNGNYYLSVSTNNYQNNLETPFLRTSNTDTGDNAIWAIYTLNGSKVLVHALDGKVVVLNGNANQEVGQAVHLEANADINSNTVRYNINTSGSYYLIQPNGSNYSFNPFGGNPNDIGIYRTNNNGSQWRRDDATAPTIPTPVITRNANGTATITCTNSYAKIFYTTDGSTPTSSSTLYTGAITVSASAIINAIAYVGPDWAGENKPKSAVAESLPADVTSQSGVGYVIFSGSNYRDEGAVGTTTFNPSTCLWTGTSGGRFSNARGYYIGWPGDAAGQYTNQNLRLSDTENGTLGQKIQVPNQDYGYYYFNGNQWSNTNNNNAGRVVFSVTKNTFPERSVNPVISGGEDTFTTTGETATYAGSGASYTPSYFDYVFYNGAHHYCLTETSNATMQKPGSEVITYSWSLSCPAANATVDNSGKVTYVGYFDDDTDVTLTLTATATSGKTLTATKTIRFEVPKTDPTGVSAEDATVYVGKSIKLPVTLEPNPCYKRLEFSSGNTSIATVDAQGNVTGVAIGTTTITVKAYKMNSSEYFTATSTITVKDKVATPEIAFTPGADGLTASTEITTTTTGAKIYYTTDGTTPTASLTEYTGSFIVNNLDVVKAIAVMTGANASYYDDSNVAELMYSAQKVPTPTINVRGNEVTFLCDEPGVTFYYTTNGSDPTTSSRSWTTGSAAITNISAGATIKVIATKTGFAPSEVASTTLGTAHVVYLDFTNGNDGNDGKSANRAKKSWAGAFALLGYGPNAKYLREQWAAHGFNSLATNDTFNNATYTSTVDNNIIYLVGEVSEGNFSTLMGKTKSDPTSESDLMTNIINSGFFKPVTISGKYGNYTGNASGNPEKYARININAGTKYTLNEDMRFEYVEFHGNNGTNSTDFMLAYYDLEMGDGIIMSNFLSTKDFNTYHHGYAQGVTNAAHILFYGGLTCDKRFGTTPNNMYNFDYFLPHPSGYKITIRSGYFSTISPGGTQWANTTSLNGAMGSPNTPVKCTITVDIDHAWNDAHQVGVLGKTSNGNPDCDVAVVIAGTHEGAMYGDVDIIVKSGRIDRVVNGTFGANNFVTNHPADSYFGRANILIDPREPSSAESAKYADKNAMVVVRELYGGGLGRFKSDSDKTNQSSTYFYGKSSVVINGGTFKSALYASGAGGVNGVGDANHHTNDARLPYLNGTTLAYGSWNNYNTYNKLGIKCHAGRPDITKPDFHTNDNEIEETIYLSDTQANIKIHGGVFGSQSNPIEGIFGGGYGFVDTELINYTNNCKPNTRAGAIFAAAGQTASTVTIDGNAEIYGNIYGAGRGDNKYRVANINYNGDNYTQLGQVAGNVALSIGGNATIHGSVYGAGQGIEGYDNMARLYGNTILTIGENAVITGTVYGGGQNGTVDKNNGQYGNTQVNIEGGQVTQDVYGGGALANVSGNTKVNLTAGKVDGDVYGGGLGRTTGTPIAALVNGNATTTLDGTIIGGSIFGANNVNGTPQGHVKVDVKATTPREGQTDGQYDVAAVYGGGNQADYVPTNNNEYAEVLIENCDNSIEYVYGGGNAAAVPQAKVTINGGTFNYVFAGGNGAGTGNPGADVGYKNHTNTEYGTGTATAIVHGGVINHLFAGSNERGRIRVSQSVSVDHESACNEDILEVYGGGNLADSNAGSVTIGCGAQVGDVYGGANQANITSDILLNITGGTINRVFGGNNTSGNVSGSITVNVNKSNDCDLDLNYVYGGGNQAAYTPTTPGAYPVVNILNGTVKKDVFGGGLGATAVVTSNPQVTVNGGNITGNVFGGGSQANTDGNTTINIKNGSVGDAVYGGGALANTGNTTVNLLGGTVHDVYGGGLGQLADAEQGLSAVAATVGTATVNVGRLAYGDTPASGSVITGNVFGCNNLNGTPTGNATVNVYKTVAQPGAAAGAYHVAAVYGGGNKAAYIPADASLTSTNTTKVEVFACDNSIQYVYGGGNAASTPATNVIINGGKFDYVFGGGNGKTEPGQSENPGANVGYYQDTDINNPKSHGAEYGSGMATTEIHDGVINHIFGGSNTRGNIRYAAITQLEHIGCDFYIGEVYAAGNEAYMDGRADLNIGCIPGLGVIYGGARKADIPNDVEININSGTYGQVFGGNNESGSINGTITINIEETGCNPVIIGEVYGGGYNAPYPGNIPSGVTPRPTGITINAYSFTQIGTIYGGGYGETAVVTGNPTVNVNQVKGTHAGTTPNGGTPIPDELGVIGTVFGGGNAAKVIGNTNVNIATSDKYTVISGDNKGNEKAIEGANIQSVTVVIPEAITNSEEKTYSGVGNVYGGGNQADVTGKTNVTIGRGQ